MLITSSAHGAKFATVRASYDTADKPFVVHEELLKYHSPFFRAALNGNFKEAETKEVRIEGHTNATIEFFVHWLYHQRLPNEQDNPDLFNLWRIWEGYSSVEWDLIRLHHFCDKYDVPALKRPIPDVIYVKRAFRYLSENSPLCRFLVDIYCARATSNGWNDIGSASLHEPHVLFYKMALKRYAQFNRQDPSARASLDLCDYHDHKDEVERAACVSKEVV